MAPRQHRRDKSWIFGKGVPLLRKGLHDALRPQVVTQSLEPVTFTGFISFLFANLCFTRPCIQIPKAIRASGKDSLLPDPPPHIGANWLTND